MDSEIRKLFDRCENSEICRSLKLKGTDYVFRRKTKKWYEPHVFLNDGGSVVKATGCTCNMFSADWHPVKFEEVLDSLDEETQTKLLFHLDLFT